MKATYYVKSQNKAILRNEYRKTLGIEKRAAKLKCKELINSGELYEVSEYGVHSFLFENGGGFSMESDEESLATINSLIEMHIGDEKFDPSFVKYSFD